MIGTLVGEPPRHAIGKDIWQQYAYRQQKNPEQDRIGQVSKRNLEHNTLIDIKGVDKKCMIQSDANDQR